MKTDLPHSQSYSKLRSQSRRSILKKKIQELFIAEGRAFFYFTIFVAGQLGLFIYAYLTYLSSPAYATARKAIGAASLATARGAAFVISVNSSVIVLTMCRMSITFLWNIRCLKWIPFQHLNNLHRVIGSSIVFFTLVHVGAHYFNYLNYSKFMDFTGQSTVSAIYDKPEEWSLLHPTGLTGQIGLVSLFLILSTSIEVIRRKAFELFWSMHHLWIVYMAAICAHGAFCFIKTDKPGPPCMGPSFYQWIVLSFAVYLSEKIIREFRSRRQTSLVKVILHPSQVLEIQIKKPSCCYRPGQYLFVQCPEISAFQWHPFTITSAPEENPFSVHIRIVGNWTRKLGEKMGVKFNSKFEIETVNPPSLLPLLRFDGPYGAASQDIFKYEVAVCIGAGIGQTPFSSILKHIWYQVKSDGRYGKLRKVYFIGICRDTHAFEWFHDILKTLEDEDIDHFIEISCYLTGPLKEDQVKNVMMNDLAGQCDAITGLRSGTNFGRPKFDIILANLKEKHPSSTIGVFFCGPVPLSKTLQFLCKNLSNSNFKVGGTKFVYHKENF